METPNQQKDILRQRITGLESQLRTLTSYFDENMLLRLDLFYEIENAIYDYCHGEEN